MPPTATGATTEGREAASATASATSCSTLNSPPQASSLPDSKKQLSTRDKRKKLEEEDVNVTRMSDDQIETFFPDEYFDDPEEFEKKLTLAERVQRLKAALGDSFDLYKKSFKYKSWHLSETYSYFFYTTMYDAPEVYDYDTGSTDTSFPEFDTPLIKELQELYWSLYQEPYSRLALLRMSEDEIRKQIARHQKEYERREPLRQKIREIEAAPDHLPLLTMAEMQKIIKRCASPMAYCLDPKSPCALRGCNDLELQIMFARGGLLESWRYAPEYTPKQKSEILKRDIRYCFPDMSEQEYLDECKCYGETSWLNDEFTDYDIYELEIKLNKAMEQPQ